MHDAEPRPPGRWFPIDHGEDLPESIRHEGAFLPRPLPSDILLSSRTHRALADAQEALGRLDEAAERLPDRLAIVRATQLREIQSSAGLNNAHLALQEVLMLDDLPGAEEVRSTNAVVKRYVEANDEAFAAMRRGASIDVMLLGQISAALAGRDPADRDHVLREQEIWLGGQRPQDAWLMAAPPDPHLRAATDQWAVWVNADCDLPLVGKVALGHYQLVILHPFAYGSDHISRLYIGLELVRSGLLRDQILPISMWIDGNQVDYRASLRRVVHSGNFDEWIGLFAQGVRDQCLDQIRLIEQLEQIREDQLAQTTVQGRGASVMSKVVSGLIGSPVTNHNQIVHRYGVAQQTAHQITRRLLDAGLVEILDNKRYKKVFVCTAVVELLSLTDPLPANHDDEVYPVALS